LRRGEIGVEFKWLSRSETESLASLVEHYRDLQPL
jgi:hypothetical protein